ncbi:MAG: hypothetical protein R3F11_32275 [Verrucomicrobiales bacterium]
MKKPLALLTAALAFGATTAPAAITNIDLDGSILNGFTIDRGGDPWVYTQANLIGFDVTAFAGASAAVVLVGNNASVPSAGNRATLLDGDFDLSTGLINMAVGNASVTLGLSAPLTNWTGPDFIFTDFDSDAADSVQILINGTTQTYSVTGTNLMTSLATDVYSSTSGTPGTLAALEASGYSKTSDTTQNVRALEIDLDDWRAIRRIHHADPIRVERRDGRSGFHRAALGAGAVARRLDDRSTALASCLPPWLRLIAARGGQRAGSGERKIREKISLPLRRGWQITAHVFPHPP